MTSAFAVGSVMPERMAAIEARLGVQRSPRRSTAAFDSVLSAQTTTAGAGTGAGTGATGTAALPASLLTALAAGESGATGQGIGTPPTASAGEAVIEAARTHLGVPYLWGGTDPVKGFDCSGLIQNAYRQIGVELPKWSRHQATMGVEVPSIDQALPGDILSFGNPVNHVGLYVGDGKMLHAPKRGDVVKISDIGRTIGSIRRIVTPDGVATTPAPTAPTALDPTLNSASAAYPTTGPATSDHPAGDGEQRYRALFEAAGQKWNVDPDLLAAVAQIESGFNPKAVSPAGARGLMQFMPATAAEMGVDPMDPASAIDGAARYLRTSLDQFPDLAQAVASYNAGRGAVQRYGGVPPFRETRDYVTKVLDAWRARS